MTSFNTTGFGLGIQNYMDTLLLFSDILCIQEHFLQDSKDKRYSNTNKLRNKYGDNFDMFIVPALKTNDQVSKGRARGGLATLWRKHYTKYVSRIPCSNFRLLGTKFLMPNSSILIINCYFPCDPRGSQFDETDLLNTLTDIEGIIRQAGCNDVILAGDMNSHFLRQTRFTSIIRDFCVSHNLLVLWENPDPSPNHFIANIDYTYCKITKDLVTNSTIDHFFVSQRVYGVIEEAGVIHSGENTSDHSPIYVKFNVGNLDLSLEESNIPLRVKWSDANSDAKNNFNMCLSEKLCNIDLPDCLDCLDLHCNMHNDIR